MTLPEIYFVYLGLILGAIGGLSCMVFYLDSKAVQAVYVLAGCIIGVLTSITVMDVGISKVLLLFIITVGYVGASIAGRVVGK